MNLYAIHTSYLCCLYGSPLVVLNYEFIDKEWYQTYTLKPVDIEAAMQYG